MLVCGARRIRESGTGDPEVGANLLFEGEARALSAPARQLTPQADERVMPLSARTLLHAGCLFLLACLLPATALAGSGGASPDDPRFKPAKKAKIVNGLAVAPKGAPKRVKRVIKAANRIARLPYRYGGGHGSFEDTAYD